MTMREDPRFKRRRIDVTRSAGRRRLRRLVFLAAATGLVVAGVFALRSPLFDVDHVAVSGAARVDEAELIALAGIELGTAMIDVDDAGARRAIADLPYVASVSVSRHWPNEVRIGIVERAPSYEVGSAGRFAVVADDGVVVDIVDEPTGLPAVMTDSTTTLAVGERFEESDAVGELIDAIGPNLARWIDRVETDEDRGLILNLVGTAEALLGTATNVDEKLIGLSTVLGRTELSCIDEIDVRVADSPIVRRGCI